MFFTFQSAISPATIVPTKAQTQYSEYDLLTQISVMSGACIGMCLCIWYCKCLNDSQNEIRRRHEQQNLRTSFSPRPPVTV